MTKIFHNPRCAKSRAAIELLDSHGLEYQVVKYLEDPPTEKELKQIIKLLGIQPQELIRKKEKLYKELGLGDQQLTDSQWIKIMAEHPKLIERPIVIHGDQAAIGRPTENIAEILA